ncbi:MAG: hypothetical protein H6719_24205 [Sandaracinaceae bacterium]|nr:hypothetical protein [Sandaracinaceae bacterium]
MIFGFYMLAALTLFVALTGAATAIAWTARDRWIGEPGKRAVAGGAFRSAVVSTSPRRQGRAWFVLGTAVLGIAWAILTFFFFAPAGALGGFLIGVGELGNAGHDRGFWLTLAFASISAIPLTVALVANGLVMVQRSDHASRVGMGTAAYAALHHGVLVAVGILYSFGDDVGDGLAPFTAIAASPGLVLAAMIAASALLARRDV